MILDSDNQRSEGETADVASLQLDARWIGPYRNAVSVDVLGMLSPTHLLSEERAEWDILFPQRGTLTVQRRLEEMLAQGKQREMQAALAEGRDPRFSFPAVALDEVDAHREQLLQLQERIAQQEEHPIVRSFYIGGRGAIPYSLHDLAILETAARGETEEFWEHVQAVYPPPTPGEMRYALSRVRWFLEAGLAHFRPLTSQLIGWMEAHLGVGLEALPCPDTFDQGPPLDVSLYGKPVATAGGTREVPPETVKSLFATLFREQGCDGWDAVVDYAARNTRVDPGRRMYVVAGVPYTWSQVIQQVAHELGAHIAPRVRGEDSPLGLLGIGTGWSLDTEEGLGYYLEWELAKRLGQRFDESKIWIGTLSTGLAAGVEVPPQSFPQLYQFFEQFLTLYRLIWRGDEDEAAARVRARTLAQTRCLRTYRIPLPARPGICFTKDAGYQRGFFLVYDAVQLDRSVLDWLANGIVAVEQIPDLRQILSPRRSSSSLLERPDLEAYILSLEPPSGEGQLGGEGKDPG